MFSVEFSALKVKSRFSYFGGWGECNFCAVKLRKTVRKTPSLRASSLGGGGKNPPPPRELACRLKNAQTEMLTGLTFGHFRLVYPWSPLRPSCHSNLPPSVRAHNPPLHEATLQRKRKLFFRHFMILGHRSRCFVDKSL